MFRKNAQQFLLQFLQQLRIFVVFLLVPGVSRRESSAAPGHILVLGTNIAQPVVGIEQNLEAPQGAAHAVFKVPNEFLFDLLVQKSDPSKIGTILRQAIRASAPLTHSCLHILLSVLLSTSS